MQPHDLVNGRFEINRIAGSGGMGTVFHARDRRSGAPVAIKVILGNSRDLLERFVREGAVLAELRHPGIVGFVASGTTPEGEAYLVMDWLEGESLHDRLARGTLEVAETVALGQRVAEALAVAHARGVVHRELQPGNLFLVAGDLARVTILDFGIARVVEGAPALTRTGATLGSPGYLSPEQARGERDIEPTADVFSLACVLFKCLTGEPPFTGSLLDVLMKTVTDPAPLASSRRADVPPALEGLLQRMLAKLPASRPRDASAVSAELAALAGPAVPRVGPAPPTARLPPPRPVAAETAALSVRDFLPADPPQRSPASAAPRSRWASRALVGALLMTVVALVAVVLVALAYLSASVNVGPNASGGGFLPCGPSARCVAYTATDPAHVDLMDVVSAATQLAHSLDKSASFSEMTLTGAVDGTLALVEAHSSSQASMGLIRFAGKGARSVDVAVTPGRLVAVEGPSQHPGPLPGCTPRAAAHAAVASGLPHGAPLLQNYHHDEASGGTVWDVVATGHQDGFRRLDGRTCALKLKPPR